MHLHMCSQPCSLRCPPKAALNTLVVASGESQLLACTPCIAKLGQTEPIETRISIRDLYGRPRCRAAPPRRTQARCYRLPMRSPFAQSAPSAPPTPHPQNLHALPTSFTHALCHSCGANSTAKHMDCPYRGSTCTDHVHPNVCMILSEACVWFAKHIFKIAFHSAKPARERMTVSCDSAHEVRARGASPPMRNRRANQAHA
jgi:hypothetical protein